MEGEGERERERESPTHSLTHSVPHHHHHHPGNRRVYLSLCLLPFLSTTTLSIFHNSTQLNSTTAKMPGILCWPCQPAPSDSHVTQAGSPPPPLCPCHPHGRPPGSPPPLHLTPSPSLSGREESHREPHTLSHTHTQRARESKSKRERARERVVLNPRCHIALQKCRPHSVHGHTDILLLLLLLSS